MLYERMGRELDGLSEHKGAQGESLSKIALSIQSIESGQAAQKETLKKQDEVLAKISLAIDGDGDKKLGIVRRLDHAETVIDEVKKDVAAIRKFWARFGWSILTAVILAAVTALWAIVFHTKPQ